MIARGGTWDTNLKVVARKTPRRAMPVPYKSHRKDPKLSEQHCTLTCLYFHHFMLGGMLKALTPPARKKHGKIHS